MLVLDQTKALLTCSEVAFILNVHINTVRRWSNRGLLTAHRVGPRRDRRFSREDIDKFLAIEVSDVSENEKEKSYLWHVNT